MNIRPHIFPIHLLFIVISTALISCRKKELPVPKPNTGSLTTAMVNLTTSYSKTVYFDLETNQNVGESLKTNWDLAISCDNAQNYVMLNGGKQMIAVKINNQTFEQVTSASMLSSNGKADHPTGRIDSMVIQGNGVYLVDKGYDLEGNPLGVFKIEVLENNSNSFTARLANINGTNEQEVTISKDPVYNYVYLNWHEFQAVSTPTIEPPKDTWDLVFTQYTEIFFEPDYMPYLVLGCLTNRYNTQAMLVNDISFENVTLEKAENLQFNNDINGIGYNWKTFLMNQSIYVVNFENVYVIKDQAGFYYKLRFVDFYSGAGEKGAPTFEYQRL